MMRAFIAKRTLLTKIKNYQEQVGKINTKNSENNPQEQQETESESVPEPKKLEDVSESSGENPEAESEPVSDPKDLGESVSESEMPDPEEQNEPEENVVEEE